MWSGPPPSRSCVAGTANLDQARGNLRDALAGLRNLAQLLQSLNVGSKALAGALPDMHSCASTMRGAVEEILRVVGLRLPADPVIVELSSFFAPRFAELESALRYASERPLNAKTRLALEQTTKRLSLELDTARGHLDLLSDALSGRTTSLNLLELVRQAGSAPPSTGSWNRETLVAVMCTPELEIELDVDARVTTTLIALGIELVAARSDGGVPSLTLGVEQRGRVSCRIRQERAPRGEELQLAARGLIEPTVSSLRAACRIVGAELGWSATRAEVVLSWPPAVAGQSQSYQAV
jgi:hypothetical protein